MHNFVGDKQLLGQSCSFGSFCIISVRNFGCITFLFRLKDSGSDCISSWLVLPFTFKDNEQPKRNRYFFKIL